MNWKNWNIHPHDHEFVGKVINKVPMSFWKHIKAKYNQINVQVGRQKANHYILALDEKLKDMKLRIDADDQDIRDLANKEALACRRIKRSCKNDVITIQKINKYVMHYGIDEPKAKSEIGVIKRYLDERWWRRQLRLLHGQKVEEIALHLNIVSNSKETYASNASVTRRRSQKTRNRNILEELEAVNELGDSFTLQELSDKSVSNPKLKRAELMTRIAGFEKVSRDLGFMADFYTLTCPSRMHSSLKNNGQANPKYDGTTPKESQEYLVKLWSLIRTALGNKDLPICGMRVTEPHHDGTPHWHFLLFMKPEDQKVVREVFKKYALMVDGDEKGAKEYRFKAVEVDPNKGSAAGYIAKYISKNIDGHGLDDDNHGNNATDSAERIEAYVSTWAIRQFQFFGSPSVTIWRELRKSKIDSNDEIIQKAYKAAHQGDWAEFLQIMGGPLVKQSERPLKLLMAWSGRPGRYDEPIGMTIIGIESDKNYVITRVRVWTINQKPGIPSSYSEYSRESRPEVPENIGDYLQEASGNPGDYRREASENPGESRPGYSENFRKSRPDISENSENPRPGDSESFRNILSEFSEYSGYFSE